MRGPEGTLPNHSPQRCVLVCTHRPAPAREQLFVRLLDSLSEQAMPTGTTLAIYVLLQGCRKVPDELAAYADDPRICFTCTPDFLPSSQARNLALDAARVTDSDIVLFPDDDCWYPSGMLRTIMDVMRSRASELLFVWYRDEPISAAAALNADYVRPTPIEVMRRTGMITMVLAGRVVREIGGLDERIGLGTDLSGGEDTDYAYRAYKVARMPLMTRAPLIGHRSLADDWTTRIAVMPRYWPGVMFQTLKHLELRLLPLSFYRCGVGVALVVLKKIAIADLMRPFARWIGGASFAQSQIEGADR